MKKVLILGAGMVVKPIVSYLLDHNIEVLVATRTKSKADALVGNHPNGKSMAWTVDDIDTLDKLVQEYDISVSLLPYAYHATVAELCIKHKKNMVTTSYVQPAMRALDGSAKEAGILILNELGLDPGIDHMSAMRIIDHVKKQGGKIEEFYSFCGALVAPEVEKNPFSYKFTWAPKGVVMACNNTGKYLRNGEIIELTSENLMKEPLQVEFPNIGHFEVYANRDSLPYIDVYGIQETKTMMRGTFRYPKFCENIYNMKKLGLFSCDKINMEGMTYAGMMGHLVNSNAENIRQKTADYLGLSPDHDVIKAIAWLGMFEEKSIGRKEDSPFEVLADAMIERMMVGNKERDMIILQHVFVASYPNGKKEVIKSSLVDYGTLETDTSIARTVALPAAVGVRMVLEGKVHATGVHIPVIPEIYNPILDALEDMNIKMVEQYGLPLEQGI